MPTLFATVGALDVRVKGVDNGDGTCSLSVGAPPAQTVTAIGQDGVAAGPVFTAGDSSATRYALSDAGPILCKSGVLIRNVGPDTVYWGGPEVTAALGMPLKIDELLNPGDHVQNLSLIWWICATGKTAELRCVVVAP